MLSKITSGTCELNHVCGCSRVGLNNVADALGIDNQGGLGPQFQATPDGNETLNAVLACYFLRKSKCLPVLDEDLQTSLERRLVLSDSPNPK